MSSKSREHKQLSQVKLFSIPIGKFLSRRSFLATDAVTHKGILQAQEIIAKNEEGLLVYFAHLGLLDVFGTAVVLEEHVDFLAVFPVAGSWFYFPALRPIFKQLVKQVPHQFFPVFRKEEFGTSSEKLPMVNFSGLTKAGMKNANNTYGLKANAILDDGGVVMLAPYGGRAPINEYLRSGSVALLHEGRPVIFSLTRWNWCKMKYEVFFSPVYRFDEQLTHDQAHAIIYDEFWRMAQLSGVSKKQMLESKSGSFFSRGLWKFLAKVFVLYLLYTGIKKGSKKYKARHNS